MFDAFISVNTELQSSTVQFDLSIEASCLKYFQTELSCFRPLLDLNIVLVMPRGITESVASNTESIYELNFNLILILHQNSEYDHSRTHVYTKGHGQLPNIQSLM